MKVFDKWVERRKVIEELNKIPVSPTCIRVTTQKSTQLSSTVSCVNHDETETETEIYTESGTQIDSPDMNPYSRYRSTGDVRIVIRNPEEDEKTVEELESRGFLVVGIAPDFEGTVKILGHAIPEVSDSGYIFNNDVLMRHVNYLSNNFIKDCMESQEKCNIIDWN